MAQLLKGPELVDEDRMAQMEIRRRGVKARLDDEWPPGAKPCPQLGFHEDIAGATPDFGQLVVDGGLHARPDGVRLRRGSRRRGAKKINH